MPRKDHAREMLAPSAEVTLAEHERLSALYVYNAEMGEKRVSVYLNLISVAAVVLMGMSEIGSQLTLSSWPSIVFVVGILLVGVITFWRLVDRRVRATEYLRAINRIHCYFVLRGPALLPHFYWPPCDDVPLFGGKGTILTGLRDVVAAINSFLCGAMAGLLVSAWWPAFHPAVVALLGLTMGILAWLLHRTYETRRLAHAETRASQYVRFPSNSEPGQRGSSPSMG